MAEGARLESVYTGNRIVGSNPTLSAITPALTPHNPTSEAEKSPPLLGLISTIFPDCPVASTINQP